MLKLALPLVFCGFFAPIYAQNAVTVHVVADEMARQISDKNFESPETRRKIGQYLQTGELLRRDFPFDRWGASDTWEAGDPEW